MRLLRALNRTVIVSSWLEWLLRSFGFFGIVGIVIALLPGVGWVFDSKIDIQKAHKLLAEVEECTHQKLPSGVVVLSPHSWVNTTGEEVFLCKLTDSRGDAVWTFCAGLYTERWIDNDNTEIVYISVTPDLHGLKHEALHSLGYDHDDDGNNEDPMFDKCAPRQQPLPVQQ